MHMTRMRAASITGSVLSGSSCLSCAAMHRRVFTRDPAER